MTSSSSEHEDLSENTILSVDNMDEVTYPHHSTSPTPKWDTSKYLYPTLRKRILVTGGGGFVGSHLVDKLMTLGHSLIVLGKLPFLKLQDNFSTGTKANLEQWKLHPNFEIIRHDVTEPILLEVDEIYHLACPASPPRYQENPIKTIKTNMQGTLNMLGLAKRTKARFLLASTSEIYGDPLVHPQHEDYWGNVNPIGPRACYDEGKRISETLTFAYKDQGVDIRIARIFNTFGPRMNVKDGRVVSNFIMSALLNQPLEIYGNGEQTRSFQYINDLVDGLLSLMNSNYSFPINLGNPEETTINEFAQLIKQKTQSLSTIIHIESSKDDPQRRQPDISRAKSILGWSPRYSTDHGIELTIDYFKSKLSSK